MGTPCQCAGLHSFLNDKVYDNLYVCDFICHGVPSPKVFAEYVKSIEHDNGSKVVEFSFRNKDAGWKASGLQMVTRVQFQNNTVIRNVPAFKDSFMNGFLDDLYLQPICYECPFKTLPKYYADITIADFWGINKVDKDMNDGKGTSLLLLHSLKGEQFFEYVKKDFYYREYDFDKAIKGNPTLFHSARENVNREHFFDDFQHEDFSLIRKKYLSAFTWAMHKIINVGWKTLKKIICVFLSFLKIKMTEEQSGKFFQFVKFGLVGVSNTAISLLINLSTLFILRPLGFAYDYVIANLMGFSLSVLWSYTWNNRYVFRLKKGETRSTKKTLLKTYMSYGFSGIILNNCLSTIWISVLKISRFYAPFMNLMFTIPINFILNKLWAYRSHKSSTGQ